MKNKKEIENKMKKDVDNKQLKKDQDKADTTDVTQKSGTTAVAAPAIDFLADANKGLEGVDSKSLAIPFLAVLQGLSPQVETVEAAKPGRFINTITNEVLDKVLVVPVAYQRRFTRWAPRESGGGYRGEYNPTEVELNQIPGLVLEDGHYTVEGDSLKDTRNHYVLMQSSSGQWQYALLSLTSTQVKKSKRWLSRIQGIELRAPGSNRPYTPPSFSHVYELTSVKEENAQGQWHGVVINLVGPVADAELYARAKAFHESVVKGAIEVAQPLADVDEAAGGTGGKF